MALNVNSLIDAPRGIDPATNRTISEHTNTDLHLAPEMMKEGREYFI